MSAGTHTPGPWTLNTNLRTPVVGIDCEDGGPLLPIVETVSGYNVKQAEANACLIAAAPDLLLALEMLLDWHLSTVEDDGEEYSAVRDARAAIAKATGSAS